MKNDKRQVVKLTEEQMKMVLESMVNEETQIDEFGVKGMRKDDTDLWDEGDQMLAMYNAEYGIEELGISKLEAVRDIIGTTIGSLAKQTSNFNYLAGRGGLDRPNKMQTYVYNKFKGIEKNLFKKICLDLIENRLENPTERVLKRKLASEIGNKRDEASSERREKLRKAGVNPDRATMIGQRVKNEPSPEDFEDDNEPNIEEPVSPQKSTPKDEIKNYLKQMYDKLVNTNPELADDIQFISDYIDSELVDKEMLSEIRKIFRKESINETKSKKRTITIKETDIKNIVKRILNEQESDIDELDYEGFRGDENLQILRDALDMNKTVSVAFVKKDGSVRHMGVRRYLSSYVPSEREKTEKQANIQANNNLKRVVDINAYIKALKETGDREFAAKNAWRSINLKNVLGFLTGGHFIDLRDENEIMNRFGEEVYNSITKSMVRAMGQQAQNVENIENPDEMVNQEEINENKKPKKIIKIKESDIRNIVKSIINK